MPAAERKGHSKVNVTCISCRRNEGLIVFLIGKGGKNEIISLDCRLHRRQIGNDAGEMGAVEIEVVELLYGGVVDVYVDDPAVVNWPQAIMAGTECKKAVNDLSIPRLKHSGQEMEADIGAKE